MRPNVLFAPTVADGYKVSHADLYPEDTIKLYSNGTFRSSRLFRQSESCSQFFDDKVVWIGLQGALKELNDMWSAFFNADGNAAILRLAKRMNAYVGENRVSMKRWLELHKLGYLPITVAAVPEGTRLDMNVPAYIVLSTNPEFIWVTNYIESVLSCLIWKPATVATIAYEFRRVLEHYADRTCMDRSFVTFQAHDFSMRGMSGPEDAARCGNAHMATGSIGTDNMVAIEYSEEFYTAHGEVDAVIGVSVDATEHSVATSNIIKNAIRYAREKFGYYGDLDDLSEEQRAETMSEAEREFIEHVVTVLRPDGFISLVNDSFNFWDVSANILPKLKDKILARGADTGVFSKVVVRHDSGDPVENICGIEIHTQQEYTDLVTQYSMVDRIKKMGDKPYYYRNDDGALIALKVKTTQNITGIAAYPVEESEIGPEQKGIVETLWEIFGGDVNDKGYKVLHPCIGTIYGDGITVKRCEEILRRLEKKGFASSSVVFGVGSYTYQYMTRDTLGFAIKATFIETKDEGPIALYKRPKTEGDTLKKSAKGRLAVRYDEDTDKFFLVENCTVLEEQISVLHPVFTNGKFITEVNLADLRRRISIGNRFALEEASSHLRELDKYLRRPFSALDELAENPDGHTPMMRRFLNTV